MTRDTQIIEISTWTIVRFFAVAILIGFVYFLREVIAVLLFAVIFASAIEPTIRWLQAHKVPRILATLMIFLAIFVVFAFAVYLLIPLLAEDLEGFTLTYPIFERKLLGEIDNIRDLPFVNFLRENAKDFLSEPSRYISSVSGGVLSFTSTFFGGIFSFIILVVVSFYLAAREKGIEDFIRLIVPVSKEPYAVDLWLRSQRKMGQWLRAQLLLGAIIGASIYVGLTLLGIKYALVFAFIAAILEVVPVVGPILAAVPAVLIAFLQSPFLALMVVLLYVLIQQLESHIVVPVVMRTTIGISPIVVVIALLIGAKMAGILGLLLAVPVAAVVVEFLNDFDKRKRSVREA